MWFTKPNSISTPTVLWVLMSLEVIKVNPPNAFFGIQHNSKVVCSRVWIGVYFNINSTAFPLNK